MNVKPIDMLKVAELSPFDYDDLWQATDLLNAPVREKAFPPELHSKAWRIMRACGVNNLGSFDTMRLVASGLAHNRVTIGRLRAYSAGRTIA